MASAEQKKSYEVIKQFKGINTQANRTAIESEEFAWLENAQPIGYGNLKIVPTYSNVYTSTGNAVVQSSNIVFFSSVNLGTVDYLTFFLADGSATYYRIQDKTTGQIAPAGTFSANASMNITQWYNTECLILDPNYGYFTWNGNNTVAVGAVGVIAITNPGSGYNTAPSVVISGPDQTGGVQANAVTSLVSGGNTVGSISIVTGGSGYTNAANLTVTLSGGGGNGAAAVAGLLSFATGTMQINVIDGGSGYTGYTTPVTISGGGGTGAAGTAIISGNTITQVVMTNPGTGYTNSANITVSVTGNAVLQAVVNTSPNTGIASFSGRVWIASGRTVTYSAAGEYSDFTSVSAGSLQLTDSTLHGNIQQLLAANDFLYIFGDSSINVFSNVQVNSSGITLFTNTNVSASVGTQLQFAIIPYFRSVLFMNNYGVYALVGSTTTKLSAPLDGIFPNIDFTSPVYSGQVIINNILCAAFNFRYYDAEFTQSYRYIQAVFFDKKWFLTSQDNALQFITSVPVVGEDTLFGTTNNTLYQLYGDATDSVNSIVQTALLPMTDPIRTKQALKFGVEATVTNGAAFEVTVDSEYGQSSPYYLTNTTTWYNEFGTIIPWINYSSQVISWTYSSGYALFKSDAQQWGKYIGLTMTSNSAAFVVNTFEFEQELRTRF
jgi:hypothetical protein